jgi:acetyl-CoA acyltransferase
MTTPASAFVYDAVRTPFGKFGGALSGVRPDDLAALVLQAVRDRNPGLDPEAVGEVVLGNANGAGEENRNVARMAGLLAGFPVSVPGSTVNRLCGSSLDAAMGGSRMIETGDADIVLTGGVEANEQLQEKYDVPRERQDAFAVRSHTLADRAWSEGFYDDLVVGVPGTDLARDEGIRAGSTVESLARLKPSFRPDGTITAGNASPLSDGASAVLLGSEGAAEAIGRDPVARVAGRGAHALEPHRFGYAPVEAAEKALARAGIGWSDVGAVELNEAFAVQSLVCVDAWGIDPEIVNVRGGAIAVGHPLGASGGRVLGTLAKVMRQGGHRWGVAAICIGVGQGLAVVVENAA